ncbi:hypothetical protein NHX12_019073 [Muraenolepis orangiensis]|uniref:C-type lectin domain-containing protein n=1 Tax=Muraenolepis orangiensis TaxID=630683 RepID=A0A9Q0EW30_9TELE|nr:hypothetical protein NHX12_019073 [Muraenolepis orangiensis]
MDRGPVRRILLGLWVLGVSLGQPRGSDEVYNVYKREVSFDMAEKECSMEGRLAEFSTDQEANGVLRQVEDELGFHWRSTDPLAFWVGLMKTKDQCVVPHLPLRGFRWLSDGGEGCAWGWWWEEPQQSCTTDLCIALQAQPCPNPNIPVARWLVMDSNQITVVCWSGTKLILKCFDGRWKMNGSVLDPDTICSESQPMSPTPHCCPHIAGDSNVVEEDTWASLMVPVLVAVAVLVLLVVVVVVVVRCCLVRRSKDRAMRKAEKMAMENKEAGSKDSMETTNEKERR